MCLLLPASFFILSVYIGSCIFTLCFTTVDSRRKILIDYLSEKQRSQIACSWNTVRDQRAFAQDVYLYIFDQKPLLKSMFSFLNAEILPSDHEFSRQTNLLADFLDEIVAQVAKNNEKSIFEMCRRLGAKHASSARMHFEPDWWRLFLHGILYGIKSHLNDQFSKRNSLNNVIFNVILPFVCPLYRVNMNRRIADIVQAWNTFLNHLVDLISSAFYETRLAQNCPIKNDTDQYGR